MGLQTLTTAAPTSDPWRIGTTSAALLLTGTWNGASAQLEVQQPSSSTWVPDADGVFTADAVKKLDFGASLLVRLVLTGGDGSTSVDAEIV